MNYTLVIRDKISGQCRKVTVAADDYPNAILAAMARARKMLEPPTHLVVVPKKGGSQDA